MPDRSTTLHPTLRYASRFLLPLALLVAATAAWTMAGRLGEVDREPTQRVDTDELVAPIVSVRRVPDLAVSSRRSAALSSALSALPPDPGGLSCAVVLVNGQSIIDIRSDRALVPAYAQLLITGHVAIDVLGADFRYETAVMANELPDDNGRIRNGAYLVGGGDPVLMTHTYALGYRPALSTRTPVEELAVMVADAGVLRIDGGVIGIDLRYDDLRSIPGWPVEYSERGLVGPLTALQIDDAFAERAAANLGVAVPADDPTAHATDRFVELLDDVGIQSTGVPRALRPDEQVPSLVPVARISSPPLGEIIFQMLAVNDATAAELIMKELGVAFIDEGSTQAGGQAIQSVLQSQGVEVPVAFRDGSGLDPIGGTTCAQLATTADTIPDDHPTLDVLPRHDLPAVFDGVLSEVELDADVRVVGGIEGDASGFVARTVDPGGAEAPRVVIASIIDRSGGPRDTDLAFQRSLVELVDVLRNSISVEDLGLDD